jgi:DNA-binding GntR family transcriptional regulator
LTIDKRLATIDRMATELEILKSQSLTTLLKAEIERMILDGDFGAGARINENALAARFGVSRGPVREACRALAELGLVELIPNRGVFIRRIERREAKALYDVRAGLTGLAARLLAKVATEAQLATLDSLLDRMEAAAASFDDYYPLNLQFHDRMVEYTGNDRLMAAYRQLVKELHLFRARGLVQGGGLAVSNAEHREIIAAVRAREPARAFEAGYCHVECGKARMLAALEG